MSDNEHPSSAPINDVSDVAEAVDVAVWPEQEGSDLFGVEVEAFPLLVNDKGPAGRLPLQGEHPSVVGITANVAATSSHICDRSTEKLAFPTAAGGWITFEPGAQIEHSSAPRKSSADVRREMTAVWDDLRDGFWEHNVCLLSLGVDPWNETATIPQQLTSGRYVAMESYFASRGNAGATMMRNTCSVQVNLDAGSGDTRRERWLASQLLSPVLTAMFATSPGNGVRSRRAQAWQQLDPTRTGFPSWDHIADADPVSDTVARALAADVMFIVRDGTTTPGRAGWTFGDWIRGGHPTAGRPTWDDLESHLSTLFTEVRPRHGVLELRGIDGLAQPWWHVPLVLSAALLYDQAARGRVIELFEPLASKLGEVWQRAASFGLADPELAILASSVAELAIEAARRDPGCFDGVDVVTAESFLDEFTLQGQSPGDVLLGKMANSAAALAWAAPEHAPGGAA
ncbi:MAG: glutamate-cysteine ligase family protein [Acidimicrobiia bacterium]